MHQSVEKPIEVRRVIFSDVPTLHEGPTHNTRSASQVAKPSNINSTLPNDSALNHQTLTPVRPVQSYLEDKRDCCSLQRDTLLESSLRRKENRHHMKKHRHLPISPPTSSNGVQNELHSRQQDVGPGRTTEKSTCSSMQVGLLNQIDVQLDHPEIQV